MIEPNSSQWGQDPTLSRKFEPSNDLVSLVVYNMNLNTGLTLDTSRPFIIFMKLARLVATGITSSELNRALGNLSRSGVTSVDRIDGDETDREITTFMFYLTECGDEEAPRDESHEVDPKLILKWPQEFVKLEARLDYAKSDEVFSLDNQAAKTVELNSTSPVANINDRRKLPI